MNIIPDADAPGQGHARSVGEQLTRRGCVVHVVDLGYEIIDKHGKDVTDWVGDGHTREELIERILAAVPFAEWAARPRTPRETTPETATHNSGMSTIENGP